MLHDLEIERDRWRAVLDLASDDVDLTDAETIDGSFTVKELLAHVAALARDDACPNRR